MESFFPYKGPLLPRTSLHRVGGVGHRPPNRVRACSPGTGRSCDRDLSSAAPCLLYGVRTQRSRRRVCLLNQAACISHLRIGKVGS